MNQPGYDTAPISPLRAAGCLTECWSPRVIAELDDYYVKVARLEGEFEWHTHQHEDELFYVLQGCLHIELPDQEQVLQAGELYVVPRGVRHKPSADGGCLVMLVEQRTTAHAGDADTTRRCTIADQLRPIAGLHATRAQASAAATDRHPDPIDAGTPPMPCPGIGSVSP